MKKPGPFGPGGHTSTLPYIGDLAFQCKQAGCFRKLWITEKRMYL